MANSFLGSGMKFPPQIDSTTGRIAMVSENESVKESVYLILMTQRTERFTRPEFGSDLLAYTFMDLSNTSISMLTYRLTETLKEQEPRIGEVNITTENAPGGGVLLINVDYTVISTNTRDNLVFPFYLNAEPEQETEEPEFYQPEIIEDV
ncbi:MAG: GPW/gp25 family protein [Lachnospiraceae bacterium]|nr:GPW/gp25 family protein [Lachnospiraceae bacterium]